MINIVYIFPGESPSSSASDIDNLNNQSTVNKSASLKVVNPPQMVGTHVIAARNRPTYMRLLDFVSAFLNAWAFVEENHIW